MVKEIENNLTEAQASQLTEASASTTVENTNKQKLMDTTKMNGLTTTSESVNASSNDEQTTTTAPESVATATEQPETMAASSSEAQVVLSTPLKDLVRPGNPQVAYSVAKASGCKPAFIVGNRNISSAQLNKLEKDLKDRGLNKFVNPCKVMQAKDLLEKDANVSLVDIDGKPLTLSTLGIDNYLAIIDGQHRVTACEDNPEIDVDLEIVHAVEDVHESIRILNTCDRNWNNEDLKDSNVARNLSKSCLHEKAKMLQSTFNVSSKLAEYGLTFVREASKKSDLVKGKDTTEYSESKAERGLGIFEASACKFNENQAYRKIQFMDAVVDVYNRLDDDKHSDFARNIRVCIATMDDSVVEKIDQTIADKNYGTLNELFRKEYTKFLSKSEEEILELKAKADENIRQYQETLAKNSADTLSVLKSGSPKNILANRQKLREEKARKQIEREQEKAKKVAAKKSSK